jgi:hypothetical protein
MHRLKESDTQISQTYLEVLTDKQNICSGEATILNIKTKVEEINRWLIKQAINDHRAHKMKNRT